MKQRLICGEVRILTDAFLDDELMAETTISIITHASTCAACRILIDEATWFKSRVRRAVAGVTAPAGLADRVRRRLRAA